MALHRAVQFFTHSLRFGLVEAEPDRPRFRADIRHIEKAAVTVYDSRQLFLQDRLGKAVALQTLARLCAEKLAPFRNDLACIRHIDSLRIGGIDPFNTSTGVSRPDRLVDPVEKTAEKLDTLGKLTVLRL